MSAAKLLILENSLGQKVRTFSVQAETIKIVYLKDSRRIEAVADLKQLDTEGVEYSLLQEIKLKDLKDKGIALKGLGQIRLSAADVVESPRHNLPEEEDKDRLAVLMKKTAIGHVAAVAFLLVTSWVYTSFIKDKPQEPALVTIELPKKEEVIRKLEPKQKVQVSEKKIKPTTKQATKNHVKKVTRSKVVAKNTPKTAKNTRNYKVNTTKATDVTRVGALAALGGIKTGARNAEGLDANSLKNIRAAGKGSGGGGIGVGGSGGARGYMPGKGLIAGSAGGGSRASGAGGYGTRGAGGGKAGYGKIAMVGGTSPISLSLDDEASVEGGLDRDQIQAVINRNIGQITYCYEKGLQGQPNIGGRVAIDFVIGTNGRVNTAKVAQTSLGSRVVENCMVQKLRSWKFPKPVGNVQVDVLYPFELTRVSSR